MDRYLTLTGTFDRDSILDLVRSGCTGFRLILKATSISSMMKRIEDLKRILSGSGAKIMVDLPGLKAQLGVIKSPATVTAGDRLVLAIGEEANLPHLFQLTNLPQNYFSRIQAGHRVLIGDGGLELIVNQVAANRLSCSCVGGKGLLTTGRSINFPDSNIRNSALSQNDEDFLSQCSQCENIDEIAISFVDEATIIQRVRVLLTNPNLKIISKIESLVSIPTLSEIASLSDKLLLARGDLSAIVPRWELFEYQDAVVSFCRQSQTDLIVGTGLFSTLVDSQYPSIAETMDLGYLLSKGVTSFLIADDVSVIQPRRAMLALRSFVMKNNSELCRTQNKDNAI